MDLPEWVIDELQPFGHAEWRLVAAVFRFGREYADGDGSQRVLLKRSLPQLAGIAGCSQSSVQRALQKLATAGLLRVHDATQARAARALSAPTMRVVKMTTVDQKRVVKMTTHDNLAWSKLPPSADSMRGQNDHPDDGDDDLYPDRDRLDPSSSVIARALDDLRALDVEDPEGWLREYGIEAVNDALNRLDRLAPQNGYERGWAPALARANIRNAAGMLWTWLEASARKAGHR